MLADALLLYAYRRVRFSLGLDEQGAAVVEYTILLSFLVVLTIGGIQLFGGSLSGSLAHSGNAVCHVAQNGN